MAAITMDTLKLSTKLKSKGFSEVQAHGVVEAVQEGANYTLAAAKEKTEHKLEVFHSTFKHDFERMEALIRSTATDTKYEILKWIIPLILGIYAMVLGMYGLVLFKLY